MQSTVRFAQTAVYPKTHELAPWRHQQIEIRRFQIGRTSVRRISGEDYEETDARPGPRMPHTRRGESSRSFLALLSMFASMRCSCRPAATAQDGDPLSPPIQTNQPATDIIADGRLLPMIHAVPPKAHGGTAIGGAPVGIAPAVYETPAVYRSDPFIAECSTTSTNFSV